MIPKDLDQAPVPTVCFQIDTYTYTHRRICWSMLFDYAALFHPGFEDRFRRAGHPRPLTLLHAIDPESFQGPEHERVFDIGWVGRTDGPYYKTRRKVLPLLAQRFLMNDWQRRYSYEEMVEVYKRSKIVVNISRDDYPQDLNLRCLEAMAAGALLITKLPTELSRVGFQEGEHFIGYTNEQELLDLVRYYLNHDLERRRIAETFPSSAAGVQWSSLTLRQNHQSSVSHRLWCNIASSPRRVESCAVLPLLARRPSPRLGRGNIRDFGEPR